MLKRRDGSCPVDPMFTGDSGFSSFIGSIFNTAVPPIFPFLENGCSIATIGLSKVAIGYGHDHVTQAQGQYDGVHSADTA
jgi:hypothetical protein